MAKTAQNIRVAYFIPSDETLLADDGLPIGLYRIQKDTSGLSSYAWMGNKWVNDTYIYYLHMTGELERITRARAEEIMHARGEVPVDMEYPEAK